jgi:hypothetical protein
VYSHGGSNHPEDDGGDQAQCQQRANAIQLGTESHLCLHSLVIPWTNGREHERCFTIDIDGSAQSFTKNLG